MPSVGDFQLLHNYLIIGSVLLAIGTIGFVTRRNLFVMLLSVAIMFQGAALVSTGFSAFDQTWAGQLLALFALAVSAVQIVLVLAVLVAFHRRSR